MRQSRIQHPVFIIFLGLMAIALGLTVLLGAEPAAASKSSAPGAPQNLTGIQTLRGIALSWDAPSSGSLTGYQILRRRPAENEKKFLPLVQDTRNTATTYTDTSVTGGTKYIYRVKAVNQGRTGKVSNAFRVTFTATLPKAPTGLAAEVRDSRVVLTWTAPQGTRPTDYQVLRRSPTKGENKLSVYQEAIGSSSTEWTDEGIEANTKYVYRVAAINSAGVGPPSSPATADVGSLDDPEDEPEPAAEPLIIIYGLVAEEVPYESTMDVWVNINNIPEDSDPDTLDAVVRMDVLDSNGNDSNICEGTGIGTDHQLYTVTGTLQYYKVVFGSATCPIGTYSLVLDVTDGNGAALGDGQLTLEVTE